jgi:hypothetical protein
LVLDDEGVHVTIGKHHMNYPWADISSAHVQQTTVKGTEAWRRAVHIKLKGRLTADYYDDWIDGSFGIDVDELQGLIQQGMQRWGNPIPADLAS